MARAARRKTVSQDSRMDIRMPVAAKQKIEFAARLIGSNTADFTRRSALDRATEVIEAHERTNLQPVDHQAFFDAMDNAKAVPALTEAFKRHAAEVEA